MSWIKKPLNCLISTSSTISSFLSVKTEKETTCLLPSSIVIQSLLPCLSSCSICHPFSFFVFNFFFCLTPFYEISTCSILFYHKNKTNEETKIPFPLAAPSILPDIFLFPIVTFSEIIVVICSLLLDPQLHVWGTKTGTQRNYKNKR